MPQTNSNSSSSNSITWGNNPTTASTWKTTTTTAEAKRTIPWKLVSKDTEKQDAAEVVMEEEATIATDATVTSAETPSTMVSSSLSSSNSANVMAGQPFLLHKTMGVPKSALDQWYNKELKSQVLIKDCYFSWHDDAMPHERKHTSLFVCPVTSEVFSTARYGPGKYYVERTDPVTGANVIWYSK